MMIQFSITTLIVEGLQKIYPYTSLIADVFIVVCMGVGIWASYQAFRRRNGSFPYLASTLLTSLGMFSSFFVLFVSLSVFNGQEVKTTLPLFLEGVKIAIIISIMAMISSVLLRIISNKLTLKEKPTNKGVTPTMVYLVLREISDHNVKQKAILSTMAAQATEHQQNIQKVLELQQSGLTNVVRGLEHLSDEFRTLAKKMSEHSVSEFVQTLEKTIQDSNIQIKEHLEEKFKHINQAARTLLGWQEHITEVHNQVSHSAESMERSRDALQHIAIHTQSIPQTMEYLTKSLQGLHQQVENVQYLHQQASESFPLVENNVQEFMHKMQCEIQRNLDLVETSLETQLDMSESSLETQLEGFASLQENLTILEKQTHSMAEQWQTDLNKTLNHFTTTIQQYTKEFNHKIEKVNHRFNHEEIQGDPTPLLASTSYHRSSQEEIAFITHQVEKESEQEEEDWQHQGYLLMEAGRYDEAISLFDRAIELKPKEFSPFYNKACCYALEGKTELTTIALRQAIALNPGCRDIAKTDPDFDQVRHDPKFQSLLKGGAINGGSST